MAPPLGQPRAVRHLPLFSASDTPAVTFRYGAITVDSFTTEPAPSMKAHHTPEAEALRILVGQPKMDPSELRRRLRVSSETFLGVWEGRRAFPPAAQRRLFALLADELVTLERLVRILAHGTTAGAAKHAAEGTEDDGMEAPDP